MEQFRPLISQTSNFVDPLSASLSKDDDTVSVGEDPINYLTAASASERLSMHHEDYFSASQPARVLGGSLPYCTEWAKICKCAGTETIQSLGRNGELRASRFRSVCWLNYLRILPDDHTEWLKVIRNERDKYETVRLELMVTPGLGDESLDPLLNNPLSQHEQSPWNQYFEDSELKKLVRQDVVRTFPEVEFFQSPRIRDLMVTVLFCYARQHPEVGYRQGMHEVLAPLIFVLHCDHQAHHQHANEIDPTSNVLQEMMDEAYLEHDAFSLFEGVMKGLEPWYVVSENSHHPDPRSTLLNAQPFARPQDIGPTNLLVQKLTSIHDSLLQRQDPDLYTHLQRLEIPPQIYGIRWIRLLFGREFPLHDLLMVWDAIFSDIQPTFPMVDFLTVAMLSFIRELLLAGDYTTCLKFLMRYPSDADVQYIIQLALHLRTPKQYPRPPGYSCRVPHQIPTVGGRPDVHRGPQPVASFTGFTRSSSVPRTQNTASNKTTTSGQMPQDTSSVRRLSSPNAFTDPLNAAVIFSNSLSNSSSNQHTKGEGGSGCNSSSISISSNNNQGTTRASKVVSGLVRLGGKLGRPRDLPVSRHLSIQSPQTPSPNTVAFVTSQGRSVKTSGPTPAMKELAVVRTKSAPVCARSRGTVQVAFSGQYQGAQSSDESEEEEVSERKASEEHDSEGLSVEDLSAVCLGCAMNLSHHTAALKTQLAQLQVQPDLTLSTALDGITEVIETLSSVRGQLCGSSRTSVSNGQVEGPPASASSMTSAPIHHHPLSHTHSGDQQVT